MADVFNFLKSSTVEQIMLGKAEVVVAKSTDLINDAYKVLTEKNVLSVPIQNEQGKIYGFLDEIDILYYAVEVCLRICQSSNSFFTMDLPPNLIERWPYSCYLWSSLELLEA